MAIKYGTQDISAIKYGTQNITAVYQGNNKIWPVDTGCDFFGDGSQIRYWQFEDNLHEDCQDTDDTAVGTVSFVDGKYDRCISLPDDGVVNGVQMAAKIQPDAVSMWIKTYDHTVNTDQIFLGTSDNWGRAQIHESTQFGWTNDDNGWIAKFNYTWPDNTWIHIVLDRTNGNVYIDNVKFTGTVSDAPFNIDSIGKADYVGANYNFYGEIDNVKFFNRSLTDAEVEQLYNE